MVGDWYTSLIMVSITPVPGSPQGDANYSMWMCLRNRKGSLFFKAFGASTNLLSKTLTLVELLRSWRLNVAIHLRVVIHSEARSGHIMSIMSPSPSGYVTLRFFVCMPYISNVCLSRVLQETSGGTPKRDARACHEPANRGSADCNAGVKAHIETYTLFFFNFLMNYSYG